MIVGTSNLPHITTDKIYSSNVRPQIHNIIEMASVETDREGGYTACCQASDLIFADKNVKLQVLSRYISDQLRLISDQKHSSTKESAEPRENQPRSEAKGTKMIRQGVNDIALRTRRHPNRNAHYLSSDNSIVKPFFWFCFVFRTVTLSKTSGKK